MSSGRPSWSYAFLGLGVAFPAIAVVFILLNPLSSLAFLLILPSFGASALAFFAFANTFYLEGPVKPSVFDRLRLRRCPYCGRWSVKVAEMSLVGDDVSRTAVTMNIAPTNDAVFGTEVPGMENKIKEPEKAIDNLQFQEHLRCSHCGRSWTRTIVHEQLDYRPDDD